jgi:hypothetical protein
VAAWHLFSPGFTGPESTSISLAGKYYTLKNIKCYKTIKHLMSIKIAGLYYYKLLQRNGGTDDYARTEIYD